MNRIHLFHTQRNYQPERTSTMVLILTAAAILIVTFLAMALNVIRPGETHR